MSSTATAAWHRLRAADGEGRRDLGECIKDPRPLGYDKVSGRVERRRSLSYVLPAAGATDGHRSRRRRPDLTKLGLICGGSCCWPPTQPPRTITEFMDRRSSTSPIRPSGIGTGPVRPEPPQHSAVYAESWPAPEAQIATQPANHKWVKEKSPNSRRRTGPREFGSSCTHHGRPRCAGPAVDPNERTPGTRLSG